MPSSCCSEAAALLDASGPTHCFGGLLGTLGDPSYCHTLGVSCHSSPWYCCCSDAGGVLVGPGSSDPAWV